MYSTLRPRKVAQPSIQQPSITSLHPSNTLHRLDVHDAFIQGEIDYENDSTGDVHLWHRRLGHTSYWNHINLGLIPRSDKRITSFQACDACAFATQTRLPYPNATGRLWRVHSDMSGIQEPSIIDGYQHYITFIDDYSRYRWVYFTKHKDAVTIRAIYEEWQRNAVNKANKLVSFLQTNGGGEYQAEMAKILKNSGTC
jgi:hypothetical protein